MLFKIIVYEWFRWCISPRNLLSNVYLVLLLAGFFSGCLVALLVATILRIVSQHLLNKKVGTFFSFWEPCFHIYLCIYVLTKKNLAVYLDISLYIWLCMLETRIFGGDIGSIIPSCLDSGLELSWITEMYSFWQLVMQWLQCYVSW